MFVPRLLPYGRVRTIQLAAVFLAITTLVCMLKVYSRPRPHNIYEYTEGRTGPWHDWNDTRKPPKTEEVAFLTSLVDQHGLTVDIPWFATRIRPGFSARTRPSMTESSSKFMPHGFTRARVDDENLHLGVEKAVKLPFARSAKPEEIDASGVLFGISTTYSRLSYSNFSLVRDWERWLTDGKGKSNGAGLFLSLHGASKEELSRVSRVLAEGGIDATLHSPASGQDSTSRYADLIRLLKGHNGAAGRESGGGKQFFGLVDDDIFLPSMARLLRKLATVSPQDERWIGLPSEKQSDWAVEKNVTTTYGGGAVFITPALADRLVQLPCLQGSSSNSNNSSSSSSRDSRGAPAAAPWDENLYRCVSQNTKASMYVLPSFYSPQDDELYGEDGASNQGYGGGIQPFTLHHYKAWHRFDAGKGHQVASACGEDCFLQRFLFQDGWILVNGYSLSHYPDGVTTVPLRKNTRLITQQQRDAAKKKKAAAAVTSRLTVDNSDRPHSMMVIAWRGPKVTWRLLESRITERGELWQAYVRRRGAPSSYGDVDDQRRPVHTDEQPANEDSVIVLIWEP